MLAIAHGLHGFKETTMRVVVRKIRGALAWVTTADDADWGTRLLISACQLSDLETGCLLVHAKERGAK